jgi:ParB family chromosome partitioning protein
MAITRAREKKRAPDSTTPDTDPVDQPDQTGQPVPDDKPVPGDQPDDADSGQQVPTELVYVDPRTLVVDSNVREQAALDKPFIGSIRDLGVLVPISVRRIPDDDRLRVILGQRRTRAAVQAGLASVPVFVVDAPTDEKAAEIARIVEQVVENDHRAALPDGDRVAAHQQLSLLGLSAGQIARRTRTGVRAVKTSLAVAGSELATTAMHRYALTLDQAAAVADGDTDAVKALTVAARQQPDQFDHVAQRLRDARVAAAARSRAADGLTTSEIRIVEEPGYGDRTTPIRRLSRLKAADAEDGAELTVEEHAGCLGHAAYLHEHRPWNAPVGYEAVYVCTDWRAHGHADRYPDPSAGGSGRVSGVMSEQQKTERREVIAHNKAWASTQTVRRSWLQAFLARRTPPKDGPQWIAATLAGSTHEVRRAMEGGHTLACQLLGVKVDGWSAWGGGIHPVEQLAEAATPSRAGMLTLGLLLAGIESTLDRYSWRSPTRTTRSYLTALERWGYPLSDVERLAAAEPQRREEPLTEDASSGVGDINSDGGDAEHGVGETDSGGSNAEVNGDDGSPGDDRVGDEVEGEVSDDPVSEDATSEDAVGVSDSPEQEPGRQVA